MGIKESVFDSKVLPKLGFTEDDLVPYKDDRLDCDDLTNLAQELTPWFMDIDKSFGVLYDPDVDGLYSGYIMEDFLRRLGIEDILHTMNKDKVHGVSMDVVNWALKENINYLIVPDAGSGDYKTLNMLSDKGVKVLVLDHHPYDKKDEELGENIRRFNIGDYEGMPKLSGTGVTYRFLEILGDILGIKTEHYQKFVGVTVLSDVMPMDDKENRYYVHNLYNNFDSVLFFRKFKFYGSKRSLFSFTIIPFLNNMIRIGKEERAMEIVNNMSNPSILGNLDMERGMNKNIASEMSDELFNISKIIKLPGMILMLRKGNQYRTLNGVIANKLLGEYGRSAAVMGLNEDNKTWGGSFRGINFGNDKLDDWGFESHGHLLACGVNISHEDLKKFIKGFTYIGQKEQDYQFRAHIIGNSSLSPATWRDMADYNEYSGPGVPQIKVKVLENLDNTEFIVNRNRTMRTIYYQDTKGEVVSVSDFNVDNESDEVIVSPALDRTPAGTITYQLIREK